MITYEEKGRPRIVSDVPVRTNIALMEETRRPSAPERGGFQSGGTAASVSESEEINQINRQISELAARRRHLKSTLNEGQTST